MTRALRIKLDAIPAQEEGNAGLIEGVRVSLTSLGKGRSKSKFDEPVAATVTFRLALRRKARGSDEPERSVLGTLTGELLLRGDDATPLFTLSAPAEKALTLSVPADALTEIPPPIGESPSLASRARRPRPRVLPLSFDPLNFAGSDALKPSRLAIPVAMLEGFRFFELEASLEVDAATEGDFAVNDVLDGRITATSPPPLPAFDVLLIDDLGQALDGVALRVQRGDSEQVVTTDATGFVRLPADEPGEATVSVDDLAALKARLKPDWDKADRGKQSSPPALDDEAMAFALRGTESPQAIVDTATARIVQVRPHVLLARLTGMFFDLNKTFLLPTAMGGLKDIRAIYDEQSPAKLLIVGHTDTSGSPSTNDPLSLERARSVAAYLNDEVAFWEKQYATSVSESRRWGKSEDEAMASALPDFETTRQPGESPTAWFERTRSFPNTATLNSDARKQLISEYMDLDGTNVKDAGLDIEVVRHGCGENFPLDESGEELDETPADSQREQVDRRVELFFFDEELGVQPSVADGVSSKASSKEYPEWRRRAIELREVSAIGTPRDRHISVVLLSNSGNVPLKQRALTLTVEGEPAREGTTDDNGVFEQTGLPAGDHLLKVDGFDTFVAATPTTIVQRPHVVVGHVLISEDA